MPSRFCSCKLFCCVSSGKQKNFREKLREMECPDKLVAPNWWVNHNKDICHIKNYYADREDAELILLRQEIQIGNSCEYCLTSDKCKKYLQCSKEYKKNGFWTHNEKVKIWEIFDTDWSYKNDIFRIEPCNL